MTKEQLNKIRLRCEAATPGPWLATKMTSKKSRRGGRQYYKVYIGTNDIDQVCHYVPTSGTAEFIAKVRTDIPALLAEVERLTRERDAAVADLRTYVPPCLICRFYHCSYEKYPCNECHSNKCTDNQITDKWEWRGIKEASDV